MSNELERILNFEGQEIKVITDKGKELFNLANSCKVLGLIRKDTSRGTERIMWKGNRSVYDKISKVSLALEELGSGANAPQENTQYINEIQYILDEIENGEDRNTIYMSRYLTSRLALQCNSSKANAYKDWLAKLDESYSNGNLLQNNPYMQLGDIAQQMQLMSNVMNNIGQAFNGMQEFVRDSIRVKDKQLEDIQELIGFRNVNTKRMINEIKSKLTNVLSRKIIASDKSFQYIKQAIFKEFNTIKWEDIPVMKYNEVYAFVDELIEDKFGKAC